MKLCIQYSQSLQVILSSRHEATGAAFVCCFSVLAIAVQDNSHLGEPLANNEKSVQLTCKHLFHDQCIRGWTLVGKKDTCPVCLEKVDLRALYADRPWDTRNLTWYAQTFTFVQVICTLVLVQRATLTFLLVLRSIQRYRH